SSPSDTIIDSSPTTNPNTLYLCPQRNESVGIAKSSRMAAGSPTTATRIGPAPKQHIDSYRSATSSSTVCGSRNKVHSRRGCSCQGGAAGGRCCVTSAIILPHTAKPRIPSGDGPASCRQDRSGRGGNPGRRERYRGRARCRRRDGVRDGPYDAITTLGD